MSGQPSSLNRIGSASRNGNAIKTRGTPSTSEAFVLASPSRLPLELGLPHRHLSGTQAAATPSFELSDDPLDQHSSNIPKTSPFTIDRPPSLPQIDVNLAQIGKRRSIHDGIKPPISPQITVATPTSARHSHPVMPSSLERRTSTPGVHAHSSSTQTGSNPSSARSQVTFNSPVRQSSLGKVAAHAAQSLIDAVSGRNTPQSAAAYVGSRPESASGVNRRFIASPDGASGEQQFATFPAVFDETGDDEQDKGHGNRRQGSGRWTPTILGSFRRRTGSPVTTTHQPTTKQASPRFQVVQTEPEELTEEEFQQSGLKSSGRKTPARYRPSDETEGPKLGITLDHTAGYYSPSSSSHPYRISHPLSHAHKASISTASNSSRSITMHSPRTSTNSRHTSMNIQPGGLLPSPTLGPSSVGTASPLIIPQARRGAINLRPANRKRKATLARRKRAAAALAAEKNKKPLRQQLLELLLMIINALRYPSETARVFKFHLETTVYSIDKSFRDPRTGERVWRPSWLGAYIPLLIWLVVSLSSTFTVLIWHTQVFRALDRLSTNLQELGLTGRLMLGTLIFLTTFPPLPLYSTLIILCGFSFGLVQGFIISYIAALLGAIVVFLLSRSLLKGWMVELLNKSGGLKRVVRAIEKRPKLLFLVRLAPYPYNLMNTLLASSPTLTLRTYTLCTALALPKLLVHCALGTSIKNFAAYNGAGVSAGDSKVSNGTNTSQPIIGVDTPIEEDATASHTAETIKHVFGFVGVGLCIGIFIYLFSVARKAVDEELDDDEGMDEYDMVLSDEEGGEDDEDLDGDGERGDDSDLDNDNLNIARGSVESATFDVGNSSMNSTNQKNRLSTSSGKSPTMDRFNSRDSNMVGGFGRIHGNGGRGSLTLSHPERERRLGAGADGTTPNFIAPHHYNDGNPYFAHNTSSSNNRTGNNRNLESQVSLADSIVEMEKHAFEMEQEPIFQHSNQSDFDGVNSSFPPYRDGWK